MEALRGKILTALATPGPFGALTVFDLGRVLRSHKTDRVLKAVAELEDEGLIYSVRGRLHLPLADGCGPVDKAKRRRIFRLLDPTGAPTGEIVSRMCKFGPSFVLYALNVLRDEGTIKFCRGRWCWNNPPAPRRPCSISPEQLALNIAASRAKRATLVAADRSRRLTEIKVWIDRLGVTRWPVSTQNTRHFMAAINRGLLVVCGDRYMTPDDAVVYEAERAKKARAAQKAMAEIEADPGMDGEAVRALSVGLISGSRRPAPPPPGRRGPTGQLTAPVKHRLVFIDGVKRDPERENGV